MTSSIDRRRGSSVRGRESVVSDQAQRIPGQFQQPNGTLLEALSPEAEDAPVLRASSRGSRHLLGNRNFAITLVGLMLFAGFAAGVDRFVTADNLLNMVRQVSLIAVLS